MDGNRVNSKRSTGMDVSTAKRRVVKKKAKNKFFAFLVVLILMVLTAWLLFDKIFVIKSFKISGGIEYTEEQAAAMAEKIGLKSGMHMFGFDKNEAQQLAKYALSEFDSIKIEYDLPDKIVFKVVESEPAMYISQGDYTFILSEGLRVMSMSDGSEQAENLELKHVYISGVASCVAGEFLSTDNNSDTILKELYAVLKEEEVLAAADEIDVTNRFALTFKYKDRYDVKLGDSENLTVKVRFMKSIEEKLKDTDKGSIDVSDENYREGIFKAYN